jgi:hypothetical protein
VIFVTVLLEMVYCIVHMRRTHPGGTLLLLLCAVARGGSIPADEISPPERTALVQSFASQKLWLWQKRMQLQDWKVTLKMARLAELRPKTLGNIHWDLQAKTASINVLDPADYKLSMPEILNDIEFTIVHELVHLHLSALPRSEATKPAEEKAVNLLAESLINLDRKKGNEVVATNTGTATR